MMIRTGRCWSVAAIALILLSSCSVLPKSETLTAYQLPAAPYRAASTAPQKWALRVNTPHSSQIVDSTRILVVPQGNQISAYSGARWSDPSPVLVRNRLVQAFREARLLNSVSTDDGNMQVDYELATQLQAFQTEYIDGAPHVHIRLDVALVDVVQNRAVATRVFELVEPVGGKDVPLVVEGFGRASDKLSGQVVDWTLQQGVQLKRVK